MKLRRRPGLLIALVGVCVAVVGLGLLFLSGHYVHWNFKTTNHAVSNVAVTLFETSGAILLIAGVVGIIGSRLSRGQQEEYVPEPPPIKRPLTPEEIIALARDKAEGEARTAEIARQNARMHQEPYR